MMGLFDMLAGILKVRKEQINILVIGLNNSGKSTIVNHFKDPEERSQVTLPTVGFNVEKFQSECLHFGLELDSRLSEIRLYNFVKNQIADPNFPSIFSCLFVVFLLSAICILAFYID